MDAGHIETEAILKDLEKRIAREYQQAAAEIESTLADYFKRFETKDKIWQKWVKDGTKTQKQYQEWRVGQMAMGQRWADQRDAIARDLTYTTELAKQVVYNTMPLVYAENINFGTYNIEHVSKLDTNFTLYDRNAAASALSEKKLYHDPGEETTRRIAEGLEMRWNKQQIQSVMLQGLLQGESITKISKRLASTVSTKDMNASIRNARTMTTGVQNAGRVDSYKRAQNMGIDTRKQWMATLDGRTRHSHRVIDGEIADVNSKFSNGCEFPGDPNGRPEEVYNCRCTLIAALKGFERNLSDTSLRYDARLGDMTYEEWKKAKPTYQSIRHQEIRGKAIKDSYTDEYKGIIPIIPFVSNNLKKALGNAYQDFQKMVENSPVKKAYSKFADECKIQKSSKRGSYNPASDTILFDTTTKEGLNEHTTLAHECGHMFDKHIGRGDLHYTEVETINNACKIGSGSVKILKEIPSQSDEFLSALRKDMESLKSGLKDESLVKELLSSKEMKNASNGLQDALDGFYGTQKSGLLPWGHGERYYNRVYSRWFKAFGQEKNLKQALTDMGFDASSQAKAKRIARQYEAASEAFANINAALTVGGKQLEVAQKYMPNTLEAYKKIIEGI